MTQEVFEQIKNEIEHSELTAEEIVTLRTTIDQSKQGMTKEQYDGILEAINKAEESMRPFAIAANDKLTVAGDANDTKVNRYTYEITFTKPTYDEEGNITGEASETKTYKNVFITPRMQSKVTKMIVLILPYFKKAVESEDGATEIRNYTVLEVAQIFTSMDEEVYDVMYDLVAYVLGISDEDKDYMEMASVLKMILRFFTDFPEAVNEADAFFA